MRDIGDKRQKKDSEVAVNERERKKYTDGQRRTEGEGGVKDHSSLVSEEKMERK